MTERDGDESNWLCLLETRGDEDDAGDAVVWIQPKPQRKSVWLLIGEGVDDDGTRVRLLRPFSIEPPQAVVAQQIEDFKSARAAGEEVVVNLFEVGLDVYDPDEIENAGC